MSEMPDEQALVLPIVEERLRVDRRTVVTGRVRVRTEIEELPVRVSEVLSREDVEIERVPVGRYVDAVPAVRQEGEVVVYPVVEEVMVKRLFLREEVRIACRRVSEPFESIVTLRRQHAVVERIPVTNPSLSAESSPEGSPMSDRTITALYDTREAAERAKDQLKAAGVDHVDIHNQDGAADTAGDAVADTAHAAGHATRGLIDRIADFFGGHEDAHAYAEGVRRGHYLLTAKVDDDQADEATRLLDASGAVDIDAAEQGWRGEGWTGGASATGREGYQAAIDAPNAGGDTRGTAGVQEQAFGTPASTGAQVQPQTAAETGTAAYAQARDDLSIPIVEEQLKVGKREVERGGVRVRSYVVETPVTEQINLREERVTLDRKAVDRPVTDAEALMQDRTIELTESAEEAVVAKDAVVKEELTLRKDVTERTEQINDTVRRTEVDVQDARSDALADRTTSTPR